jgi:hypothetical protein
MVMFAANFWLANMAHKSGPMPAGSPDVMTMRGSLTAMLKS